MFSVRFVTADSYQAKPIPQLDPTFSEFRGSEIKHVPVIRIFGITATGEKTCLHIHGVFPYLFVPYTGEEDPEILSYRLASSLDAAINISLGSATSNTQHVYAIQRVSGTPFYGYHRKEHQFLKIYFYSPAMIKRAADLLQNGSVLNQSLQPHEAHINYILKFMMDYNVYGMNMINLRCVKHRRLTESLGDLASSGQSVNSENSDIVYLPSEVERQSTCELEIDALAQDILNRLEIEKDLELNPGLAAIWNEERARREKAGLQGGDSQLVNPKSPPRPTFNPTDNDIYQEQRLARRLQMISQCDESTLSSTPNRSVAYAAEVRDGENLLNSSHVGSIITPTIERVSAIEKEDSVGNMNFLDSPLMPASQKTPDCSILGTEDMPLVDLLDQLARNSEEKLESVDTDSVLGSQICPNDEKSDNEDDDVADLNLTCLQLDSLSSLEIAETSNKHSQGMKKSSKDEDLTSMLHVSPFTSSYEVSCSPKSIRDDENVDGDRKEESLRDCRVPQYDGAGDVSPKLMSSDNEDVQYKTTNAKDFSHLPQYNRPCAITSESRKANSRSQSVKISTKKNSNVTKTINNVLDIEMTQERAKTNENVSNPQERPCAKAQPVESPSTTTSDNYLVQYPGTSYAPYDRLLEIGTDLVTDLDVMHSSMEIGILLSSEDTEKVESTVEIVEEEIPLEAVLNGDPCFTESAELDKSDLTELHDQYVSLFGNVPLPEVSRNSRNENDNIGNLSNFTESDNNVAEKNSKITTPHIPQVSSVSRDSSSSSENVAPNIQEPETQGCPTSKLSNENEAQSFKEASSTMNDNSDYNCNVVATWAELQNLLIVDKSKIDVRTSRSRRDGKCQLGLSTMKRRGIRLASTEQVAASQILHNSSEKISFQVSNSCPSTPSKIEENSLRSMTKRLSLSISAEKEKPETRRNSSDGVVENFEQRLSCGLLSHIPRLSTSLIETGSEREFQPLRTAASLDAFHRSIIGSDNPLADARTTLSGVKHSPLNENVNASLLADFDETSVNRLEEFPEHDVRGISHYSSDRSHNSPTIDNREHRHCSISRNKKIVADDVFTSDDIWIIEKRKRGRPAFATVRHPSPCSGPMCRLPVIRLKKIQQGNDDLIDVTSKIEENSMKIVSPSETSENNLEILDSPLSPISRIDASIQNVEFPEKCERPTQRKSRGRRKRTEPCSKLEADTNNSPLDKSVKVPNIPLLRGWTKSVGRRAHRFLTNDDVTTQDSYNTRRNPTIVKYPKQRRRNAKSIILPEESRSLKRELKKPRARTKYKEDNLPGIPGITKPEPVKRRRSKKNVVPSPNGNSPDNTSAKTTASKKILPSKLFPNWGAERETPKSQTYAIIDKLPGNGLVLETRKLSTITPEKRKGRTIKHPLQISPIPKRNIHGGTNNSCKKYLNFSPTPEPVVKKRQSLIDRMKATPNEGQLSEAVTLSLMMREATSRGTRAKLRMILEKRLNDQTNYNEKKEQPSEKTVATSATNSTVPEILITSDVNEDTEKVEEDPTSMDESQVNNIEVVETSSFETDANEPGTVADMNETTFDKSDESEKCDSTPITLDVSEVPNPPEYDNSTLSTEFCSSVDEETSDIFDAEATVDSVIVETTNVEELSGETKQLAYDTDRYENAIKEANFFAGKNYTIDAVSLEIPTCLFEEDSNSEEKRMPKRGNDCMQQNYEVDCNTTEDDSSELSVDPRDLDVYDVESLTPSSSLCALNDSIDNNESIYESSETEDLPDGENLENVEMDSPRQFVHEEISRNIVEEQETTSEFESSFEEESPAFETLSPKPQICHLVSKALQEEFTAHSIVEDLENTTVYQKSIVTITANKKSFAESQIPTITPTEETSKANDSLSIVIDNSHEEIPFEDKNDLDDTAEVDNDIKKLVAQAITDFENEQELSDMCTNDDEPISIIDTKMQLRSNVKETANCTVREEILLSARSELELKIASGMERMSTAIIENKSLESNEKELESEVSSKKGKDSSVCRQKKVTTDIEESVEVSKIAERETILPISPEKVQVSCLSIESRIQRASMPTEDKGVQTLRTEEWLSIGMRNEQEVENIVSEDKREQEVVGKIVESTVDIQAQQDESGVSIERIENDETKDPMECQPGVSYEAEVPTETEPVKSRESKVPTEFEPAESPKLEDQLEYPSGESQKLVVQTEFEPVQCHELEDPTESRPAESHEPEDQSRENQKPKVVTESEPAENHEPEEQTESEPAESHKAKGQLEYQPGESRQPEVPTEFELAESHEPDDQTEYQPEESQTPEDQKESEPVECHEPEVQKESTKAGNYESNIELESTVNHESNVQLGNPENHESEVAAESKATEDHEPKIQSIIEENCVSEIQSKSKTMENCESTIQLETTEDHQPITRTLAPEDSLERPQIESHESKVPTESECTDSHDRKTNIESKCIESHEPTIRIETESRRHQTPVESECTKTYELEVPIQLECTEHQQQKLGTESEKVEGNEPEVPIELEPAESHQTEIQLESESVEKLKVPDESESTQSQESESREQEIKSKVVNDEIKTNNRSFESSEKAPPSLNTSSETESLNVTGDHSYETRSKGVECRPVSIKLLNIDLSKIRNFGPKNRRKIRSKIKQSLLSKANEMDNVKETLVDKVVPTSESLVHVEVNTEKLSSLDNLETDLSNKTEEDNEKLESSELKTTVSNNRQKTCRRSLKVPRMPERRSVRIYAEMTKNESKQLHQEIATKFVENSKSTGDESTPETVTNITAGLDSLTKNTKEKAFQEREFSQVARTLLDENSRKISDETTTMETIEKSGNIGQELVLSEQKISSENSTRSLIKPSRRGRSRKNPQTNSQEVTSSQKVPDENTAPTFIRSKRTSGSRKNSQSNVQESFAESKSTKSTSDDNEPKIMDKTSLTDKGSIEIRQAELESRFAETSVETKNSILQSQTSYPKVTESTPLQSALPLTTIPNEFLPPSGESLMEILYQEIHSPIAFSLLAREIEEANSSVDSPSVTDKGDQSLWEKPSRTKERIEEITEERACRNNVLEKRIAGRRSKQKCLARRKVERPAKRCRRTPSAVVELSSNQEPVIIPEAPTEFVTSSEKQTEEHSNPKIRIVRGRRRRGLRRRIRKAVRQSSKHVPSPKQRPDETVEALEKPKVTEEIVEGNIKPNTSITHKRRLRYGNNSMLITSDPLPECESITEETIGCIASQGSELLLENISEEDTGPKTSIVPKRITRSGKSPEDKLDSVSQESNASSETTMKVIVESSSPAVPKRRCRPAKGFEKENPQGTKLKKKYSQGSQSLREISDENNVESKIRVIRKRRRRYVVHSRVKARKSRQKTAQVIEEEKSGESEVISRSIAEENIKRNIFIAHDRFVHNQETNTDRSSQEEISKHFSEHESLSQKIAEENDEPKKLAAPKRRGRSGKVPETNASMVLAQETTTKENKPEDNKQMESSTTRQSAEMIENLCKNNISAVLEILPKELPDKDKPKTLLRPKKRVRFDEESIRRSQQYRREYELSLNEDYEEPLHKKHYNLSLTKQFSHSPTNQQLNNEIESNEIAETVDMIDSDSSESLDLDKRCLFIRRKIFKHQRQNVVATTGKNGVTEKATSILYPDNVVFLNLSSLQESKENDESSDSEEKQKVLRETPKVTKNEQCTHVDEKLMVLNHSSVKKRRRLPLVHRKRFMRHNPKRVAAIQLQEPKIVLKRLSQDTLKSHGITYKPRKKKFVKLLKRFTGNVHNGHVESDDEFLIPAYDGAADLSSSDSSNEDPDVTIAREEKRVCVYESTKKATNSKRESIVTPKKRKLDCEVDDKASSPSTKRLALATAANEVPKTPYRSSPSRTSMLKSPGRVSGNYSPLKIIVTSPKVRRETSESRLPIQLIDSDDNAKASSSTASCVTTPKRNKLRLHDSLLRGKLSNRKPTICELGDKHGPVATTRSDGLGELDGIQSSGQRENRIVQNVGSMMIRSEPRIHSSSTRTFEDDKGVRKKLVFSCKDEEAAATVNEAVVEVSKASDTMIQSDNDSFKLMVSDEQSNQSARIDENNERTEISRIWPNVEATMFDAQPGPSRVCTTMDSENRGPYEITTDEDSDDDDPCNVTFTQYVDSQMSRQDSTLMSNHEISSKLEKHLTIMPKFNPPSRQRIIDTMDTYGIPKFLNQEPFFSNPVDVPKEKELAHKMLKVPSKSMKDLPVFVPSVDGVTGLARWRKMIVNEFYPHLAKTKDLDLKLALAGNERIVITPLVQPPTQREARNWLRARKHLEMKKKEEEEQLKKNFEAAAKVEIHGQAAGTEDKHECSSNVSDSASAEPSPDGTLVFDESDKMLTLEIQLANKVLTQKAKDLAENTFDLQRSSRSREETSERQDTSGTDTNASLLSVLKKSRLFRNEETSRHLGISCGQIEFLSDSTRSNVANENLRNVKALTRYQYLTIMCLEVFVTTRGDLLPDTLHDPIAAIFFSVQSDVPPTSNIRPLEHGVIVLADTEKSLNKMYYANASNVPWTISFAKSEEALLNSLVNLITRVDPEILIGWELETLSWGYVFQRASHLGMNLSKRVSRIPTTQCKWETQTPDIETLAEVKLPGRIVLDIWRLMRHEAALLSYTFESVMHHVLNERISCPSFKVLTEWWNLEKSRPSRWRVVEHYSIRVLGVFRILDQLDIIGRTSELARLFGIQFFEVFSRGSQFRVESVMLRLAKPMNYIAVSPSSLQRASMRAMEALPLIMEPESMFYSDPLIVLDFQSLYPSIIIAHNYCFSTCLGRIEHIGQPQPFEFGAYTLRVPKSTAMKLQNKVNYAPCGVAYVKPEVRLGILPRMLTEILETRFMVKKAMKDHNKDDKTLQRALHSRQMGLKFLANVTYGYTAANFSGRMPCIEVGDSVVSKSKETLERAIKLVETTPKWGARVVYGDTDSLFILVPGKSKADAFIIGNEIADAVTASNPPPIKLRFEKVMYPAILQTKKRYCGYMYETPEQKTPTYLAKGIETVRRDGCPAVSKILEKTLKILFETKDVSLVKSYVTRQLDKILRGKVSIQDLTFAKEFRGLKGYRPKACVPALELTRRLMRKDPRAVPRTSERVRYVIVAGAPNQALIHCVRSPWELINDPGLRPNAIYYITRVIIPPLNRCLNLMGVDAHAWYQKMPHRHILDNPTDQPPDKQKLTIFQYFGTIVCVSCGKSSNKGICMECLANPADTLVVIHEKIRWLERTNSNVTAICQSCVGQADTADCSSLDCPILYRRAQSRRELAQANHLREIIECGKNLEF